MKDKCGKSEDGGTWDDDIKNILKSHDDDLDLLTKIDFPVSARKVTLTKKELEEMYDRKVEEMSYPIWEIPED